LLHQVPGEFGQDLQVLLAAAGGGGDEEDDGGVPVGTAEINRSAQAGERQGGGLHGLGTAVGDGHTTGDTGARFRLPLQGIRRQGLRGAGTAGRFDDGGEIIDNLGGGGTEVDIQPHQ